MPKTDTYKRKPTGAFPIPVFVILGLVVIGGVVGWFLLIRPRPMPQGPVLTPEAKAYVRYLRLSDVDMKAKESYLRQQVVEIVGKITTNGNRTLKLVEINCVFYDPYGRVVLRERVPIVGKTGSLKPGETKSFRLPFDNLPESWNQSLPQLVIAQIIFG